MCIRDSLNGLSFSPNLIKGSDPKPVLAAVRRVLPTELKKRAQSRFILILFFLAVLETSSIFSKDIALPPTVFSRHNNRLDA